MYKIKKIVSIIILVITLLLPIFLCYSDNYFNGDEIVSFSMANNDNGGFIFSSGRVASYIENRIIGKSLNDTLSNVLDTAKDIFINRKNSLFFKYKVNEIKHYSKDEILDITSKTHSSELFNISKTWLYSQSDESNSFLYYCILNIVSSIIPSLSGTKWPGFVINYMSYVFIILLLNKILNKLNVNRDKYIMICTTCLSISILGAVTYIRAYMMAIVFALLLVNIHIDIFNQIIEIKNIDNRALLKLFFVYIFGFICHYTIGIVLFSLGLTMFIVLIKNKISAKIIIKYVTVCFACVLIGVMVDPKCVFGLLNKFIGNQSRASSFVDRILMVCNYVTTSLFSNILLCIVTLLLVFFSVYLIIKRDKSKLTISNKWVFLFCLTFVYVVVIILATNSTNYCVIMFPCLSIVLTKLLLYELKDIKFIIIIVIIINIISSTIASYRIIVSANIDSNNKEKELSGYKNYSCIYFRNHGNGYSDIVHLRSFKDTLVISIDTENWEMLAAKYLKDDNYIIYFPDSTYNIELVNWLSMNKVELMNRIYIDDNTIIFSN